MKRAKQRERHVYEDGDVRDERDESPQAVEEAGEKAGEEAGHAHVSTLRAALQRLESTRAAHAEQVMRDRVLLEVTRREKELVAAGKQPFFHKKGTIPPPFLMSLSPLAQISPSKWAFGTDLPQ